MSSWVRHIFEGSDEFGTFPRHPVFGRVDPWDPHRPAHMKPTRRRHREWFISFRPFRHTWFLALIWERLGFEQAVGFDVSVRHWQSCVWVTLLTRRVYLRWWRVDIAKARAENEDRRMEWERE